MKSIFKFFAERHTLANLVTIMTILLGLHALSSIKRDLFPEVDFGELTITTVYQGASPEDVELNVTNKLEDEIREVSGLDWVSSFSMENISVVYVRVDPDEKDQEKVKREIRDAIDRVTELPPEVNEAPLVTEWTTDKLPVIEVGLSGDIPYAELRELAKRLEKDLKNLSGVASLEKFGYLEREVHIEVNPKAMKDYHVSLREVMMAIAARNVRATGGSFESYTDEKKVVTLAQFDDVMEVKDAIVRTTFDGPIIRIRDLAKVTDDFEEERVLSRMEGKPAISFLVNKKGSADVIRTVNGVKELVESFNSTLPDGVEVLYADDQSYYVRNRLKIVGTNGLIGLSLVLVMLACFLSIRSAFWVALGIPVTLLGVIFLMPVANVYLDVISLAVLVQVIGIIVDDGIIIAENIHKYRERGASPLQAAVEGIHEVFWPVMTTIITTFVAFAPMFFMSGMMGKFVKVVPIVMSLALFITLFEVVVALPAHVIWGLKDNGKGSKDRTARSWFNGVRRFYKASMRIVLRLRYVFIMVSIILLAISLWYAVNYMDFVLFPSDAADTFYLLVELPTGSSLQHTSDKVAELEAVIAELPDEELTSYVVRIGNQGNFQLGENENWAIVRVNLSPYAARSRVADDIVEGLREKTDQLEGFESVVYYIDAGGPPVGRPVTIRIAGTDNDVRTALADSVVALMTSMVGVKDIDRDDKPGKDQVQINIKFDRLARVGLTVADIAQTVRVAFDGDIVTSVRYGDEDIDFRVMLSEKARENPRYLRELLIPNPQGRLIPLKDVATLETGPGPSNYYHYDGERAITVTSDVVQDIASPLTISNAVVDNFDLENDWPGMRFVVGGEAQEMDESMRSLFQAFIIALLGIYFILILLFNSLTQPFIVMSAIPFGVMGVIAAFALHGQDLGFIAMMGVIGLSGVVVNDSLVLVNHINRLRRESPDRSISDIVAQGATDRLRAVLLTSLTTIAGVLPLAYGIGGSDPFIAPMVLALGWGIMMATPITLGMIPCLYLIGEDFRRPFRRHR
jgi:multidrug efflux pump subunit AcrB